MDASEEDSGRWSDLRCLFLTFPKLFLLVVFLSLLCLFVPYQDLPSWDNSCKCLLWCLATGGFPWQMQAVELAWRYLCHHFSCSLWPKTKSLRLLSSPEYQEKSIWNRREIEGPEGKGSQRAKKEASFCGIHSCIPGSLSTHTTSSTVIERLVLPEKQLTPTGVFKGLLGH